MTAESLVRIITVCLLSICLAGWGSAEARQPDAAGSPLLQVHLPRQVAVSDSVFTLGQVAILRGDASVVARAEQIKLGRFSLADQQIAFKRDLVLSRLASSGLNVADVEFSGAETTTVKRQQQTITSDEMAQTAAAFLQENVPELSQCRLVCVRKPRKVVIPAAAGDVKLSASVAYDWPTLPTVRIDVVVDGRATESRLVAFRPQYQTRSLIAVKDIKKGGVVSPENTQLQNIASGRPQAADWNPPYGYVAKRPIAANSVVEARVLAPPKPRVVLKRNETVLIRLETAGLLITAVGKTLEQGSVGELIRVRNVDSRMIIWARVKDDGSVQPVF